MPGVKLTYLFFNERIYTHNNGIFANFKKHPHLT